MAKVVLKGFDELQDAFKNISSIPAKINRDAVRAMGAVAVAAVKAQGEAMGVRDENNESGVHILDHIALSKPRKGRDGNTKAFVTFKGVRQRGNTRIWNAEIAYLNEYGAPRRGITARPFTLTAVERNADAIAAPGDEVIGGWIERTFEK